MQKNNIYLHTKKEKKKIVLIDFLKQSIYKTPESPAKYCNSHKVL